MTPFKVTGIGAVAAKNVFKAVFSENLSAPPKLKAFDDYQMNTVAHKIFVGTSFNGNIPMVGGIGLTAATSAGWWVNSLAPAAAVNKASLLKGDSGYCLVSSGAPVASQDLFFNVNFRFPYDASPSDSFDHVIGLEYEYAGSAPVLVISANKGTEGTPSWQVITQKMRGTEPSSGTAVLKPCNTGEGYDGTGKYFFTLPNSGQAHQEEIWVTEY